MKILVALLLTVVSIQALYGQCQTPTATFNIVVSPSFIEAGQTSYVSAAEGSSWPIAIDSRFRAYLNDEQIPILSVADSGVSVLVPPTAKARQARLSVCVVDGPFADTVVTIVDHSDTLDTEIDRTNPDPDSQNGNPQDLSKAERRPKLFNERQYPNGGRGGSLPCSDRHVVDGKFSDLPDHQPEWSGITPMIGRFSHMYLDYCPDTETMYLMNDWLIGTSEYQKNCYNLFGFVTGNGLEVWEIQVTHDTARPVIVELNGVNVTTDTSIVRGGAFGFCPSPSDTTPHTMYEFGVRVSTGLSVIPRGDDPVQFVPSTTTSLECDKDGVVGYGLIREPMVRVATFSNTGVSTRQAERYIPTSGIVGLATEPNTVSGEIKSDSIRYRSGASSIVRTTCSGISVIDGKFSDGEWNSTSPASGRYSDLYAQYCDGKLHVLNDWIHATEVPDNATCYNIFEMFTGNGAEHWGIWVWQDPNRAPVVIRNGTDVSADTTVVIGGAAGWGSSQRKAEPHALYEFAINVMEGGFIMQFADPGPSSYCSTTTHLKDDWSADIQAPTVYPNPVSTNALFTVNNLESGDVVLLHDYSGRAHLSQTIATHGAIELSLSGNETSGVYFVRIVRGANVFEIPIVVTR